MHLAISRRDATLAFCAVAAGSAVPGAPAEATTPGGPAAIPPLPEGNAFATSGAAPKTSLPFTPPVGWR